MTAVSPPRRVYIDWTRGIAVLLMIEAHTVDAWTRTADRGSLAFRDATVLGGFAAPLFLWLAGVAVVLAATGATQRTGRRTRAVEAACRRGVEILLLAWLFRLQAFIITPGGAPLMLFRVDVLNVMGPAMVGVGLVWGGARTRTARAIAFASIAATIAMVTPIVRTSTAVNALPILLQLYARPAGDLTAFTLFPWAGFVFAGATAGTLVAGAKEARRERHLHIVMAIGGAALVALGLLAAGRPSIYRSSSFWTSSPAWFGIRVGILMLAASFVFTLHAIGHEIAKSRHPGFLCRVFLLSWHKPLAVLGCSSLLVYWIHVELVYGYATWPVHRRLPLWGTAIGYVLFCALMYGAIMLRDRMAGAWRTRRVDPAAETAPA